MANEDESVWLTLNGEIYNYRELRKELENKGHRFKSHSDSEVVVHLYEESGTKCLDKLNGMFAFSPCGTVSKKSLLLARDRVGKKLLHYCLNGRRTDLSRPRLSRSWQHPAVQRDLDLRALSKYLQLTNTFQLPTRSFAR